ncbi:reverse transcriptase domain-containing protein [Tanacetum coccineum]
MRTRSSSNLIVESSTTPKRRNHRRSKQRVEPFSLEETSVVTMADQRTMAELLQAPTEGYGDAIVIPAILAENFELKHGLLNLVTPKQFYGFEREDPHAHIRCSQLTEQTGCYKSEYECSFFFYPHFPEIVALADAVKAMLLHKSSPPTSVKSVEEIYVTCGGPHPYHQCLATDGNVFWEYRDNIQGYVSAAPRYLKAITTRSGISYDGPPIPPPLSPLPKVVEREPEVTKDTVQPSTENIQPPVVQTQAPIDEPVVAPKPKPSIPYPSRANKQKLREKDDNLASKFVEIFRELHFELSFADALLHMPKFASMFKSLLNNKEKLFDLAKSPIECLALADLGASINLMPLSIWKKLSLPELTPTQMILELADRSTTSPSGIAKDVFVKVGKFHFLADFVVVDYVVDPRVPLIIGRPFLRMARGLIDVYGEEFTLRVDDEAITFKVGQTSRYSYNDAVSINRIDVIDVACEEYAQEVLRFLDSSTSGNPTPSLDPILSTSSPSLTPFEEGRPSSTREVVNDDPSSPLPPKELHVEVLKIVKSSIDDPLELELKDLPSHLEYAFLEGTDKLPVIIAKNLKEDEKVRLLKFLKSHKRVIAWKIFDIKGIDDSKPAIQHQRRVNPQIHEVIKKEVIKLLDVRLIYLR